MFPPDPDSPGASLRSRTGAPTLRPPRQARTHAATPLRPVRSRNAQLATSGTFRAIRRRVLLLAAVMLACGDPSGPEVGSIIGTWDLIGFSDAGVEAQADGTWTFGADGTHSFQGTVTFPDEPPDEISGEGMYEQNGATLELTVGTESSTWTIEMAGDLTTLTENEPAPANEIRLRRR